jgi:hypothetical protein
MVERQPRARARRSPRLVILYHFTGFAMWSEIEKSPGETIELGVPPEGIRPGDRDAFADSALAVGQVVWLTADYETSLRPADDHICVALQVKIPQQPKLINWHAFARKRIGIAQLRWLSDEVAPDCGLTGAEMFELTSRWWFYRGTVKPEWIIGLQVVRKQKPFWRVPNPELSDLGARRGMTKHA